MSRSDLLLQLVRSGGKGDLSLFKRVVEAIIAEETAKQHNIFADKLREELDVLEDSQQISKPSLRQNREGASFDYLSEVRPALTFDDLVLNAETKKNLLDLIEEQRRADLLRSYSFEPRHRILLIGPPGNGKTSAAEAIASALMLPLLTVRYENIITSYLGETSSRLKKLFDYVRSQQCVLFFDEFDAIGKERGDAHETGEIKRVVSSLLLHIDQLPPYVIVIAATNHSDLLDKAVWRRFQVKSNFPHPSSKDITTFVTNYQKRNKISFGVTNQLLTTKLKGLSFSEIKDFCDDIMRSYILSLPNSSKNLKKITTEKLSTLFSVKK